MNKSVILFFIFSMFAFGVHGQIKNYSKDTFRLKGKVLEKNSNSPIFKVNIEIEGGDYTTTSADGTFVINASLGDNLVIKSDDFKTVYYEVTSKETVTILVENKVSATAVDSGKFNNQKGFIAYLDSAKYFSKRDAEKSIEYITKALESDAGKLPTKLQKSLAFETLGDTYMYWQLYDLASENYKRSITSQPNNSRNIKLAASFMKSKNYQEAITLYNKLQERSLTARQKVAVFEGLGDTYTAIGEIANGVSNYKKGLEIAVVSDYNSSVIDLNSKIAAAYAQSGNKEDANDYFGNSLDLSKKESPKRAAEEKNKVADFYNLNGEYEKEIELREQTLTEVENLSKSDETIQDNPALSPQRQNYKIANAFIGQEKYNEAIPYLERSIEEADKKEDLYVEKDARRKLSEVYRDIGEYGKAAEGYERYVEVVDELYIKKEQEISQAARFAREISTKQNRIAGLENERELNESRYKLAFENQELIETNNRTQKWIIGSLIAIALLLLFTAYTQFKNIKQQKFANNLLALKSLRSQMNPHFIFNALNSVNSFIATNDERAANKYLSEFSQLMRTVLENSEEDFIPLAKEIEMLEIYTRLEHFRFKDKFDYSIHVDEGLLLDDFVIPPMLLQPYVENAVWHGLRYKEERGNLTIDFEKIDASTVKITIEDDGIGRKKSADFKTENQKLQKSKGMGNIKKRISILNEMYKDKVDVVISDVHENTEGTRVVLMVKKD
ncbi:MAG: histidine kinase [Patiriisocius sp.]|uniref:histidine kinase n=1 Tax=Patiriisocius sp. TaxID=2822396 RepID=UPI003EF2C633